VEAPESIDDMARVRAALPADVPLVANMVEQGRRRSAPRRSSRRPAIASCSRPVAPLLASDARAPFALRDAGARRRDARARDRMVAFGELNDIVGLDDKYRRERDWTE
jgi:2-methylisocitrate lyase-like PEP mutase family enzyme